MTTLERRGSSWAMYSWSDYDRMPPDLTDWGHHGAVCPERTILVEPDGRKKIYLCTRRSTHAGRHASGDKSRILAVWT